jgi:membrane-associated phospholipid phosphatase
MHEPKRPYGWFTARHLYIPVLQLVLLIAITWAAGAILVRLEHGGAYLWIDRISMDIVGLHTHTALNRVMTGITFLGRDLCLLVFYCGLVLCSYRTRDVASVRYLTVVMVGGLAFDNLIKPLVGRPRPTFDPLINAPGASFPSGHATAAAAMLVAVGLLVSAGKPAKIQTAVWIAVALGSGLMGFTRIYLGVHWPTDVVAGIALGAGWAILCWRSQETADRAQTRRTPRLPS